jgi:DNA-binding MarR family transcriptional regulator
LTADPIENVGPSHSARGDYVEAVVEAIFSANRLLVTASNRALEGLRSVISPLQLRALTVLALGPQRLIDLADAVGVAPSTATRLCDTLMAEGLILKDRDDADRREVHLSLAPRGRRLLSDLENRRRQEFECFVKSISIKERRQLRGLLWALCEGAPPDIAG